MQTGWKIVLYCDTEETEQYYAGWHRGFVAGRKHGKLYTSLNGVRHSLKLLKERYPGYEMEIIKEIIYEPRRTEQQVSRERRTNVRTELYLAKFRRQYKASFERAVGKHILTPVKTVLPDEQLLSSGTETN